MTDPLVPRRDAVVWTGCFVCVAWLLVILRFASTDGDSALYAGLADRLSQEPVARWVAPEWWGLWPEAEMTGYFREHPAGALWMPAALARLGVPGHQAAYIVGIGAGLAALLLAGALARRVTTTDRARQALVLLQLMPLAFLFRIRANHEYLMLVSLLVVLYGLERTRQSWWTIALVAGGMASALLVKGIFVSLVMAGAALWVAIDPSGLRASRRGVVAVIAGVAVTALVGIGYELWFRAVTGGPYWVPYLERQLGQVEVSSPVGGGGVGTLVGHIFFYVNRMMWHAAPWSFAIIAMLWTARGAWRSSWRALPEGERRGLLFALTYGALLVVMLSPSSRVAERYIFSGTYVVATAGAIVALRAWPDMAAWLARLDRRVPALPAFLWLILMIGRLALGPWLPRIG